MNYLPDELLFDILSRVPAVDIHENARLVCRRWKRVIHGDAFTKAHLHRTGYGLLISTWRRSPRVVMAAIQGGGVEVSELRTLPESMDMVKVMVKAGCNGLVLVISGSYAPDAVTFVVNPSTKCCFKLPTFRCNRTLCYFGIAYAAASMKYKVVAAYRSKRNSMLVRRKVLTLGVDNTWRRVRVPTKQLSPKANELLCANPLATGYPVYRDPLITEGHMHWAPWLLENDVLTLNIETEVFVETPVPLAPLDGDEISSIMLPEPFECCEAVVHKNSLAWC